MPAPRNPAGSEHTSFVRRPAIFLGNKDVSDVLCILLLFAFAALDVLWSTIGAFLLPFWQLEAEQPTLICANTEENKTILARMPSLARFEPTWWARGRWAQTIVSALRAPPNPLPYARTPVRLPDGVCVSLDYKQPLEELPANAPLILVLHGLGGHSMTSSCNNMAEALARGGPWRVVVYNRRGHGGNSLLPVTTDESDDEAGPGNGDSSGGGGAGGARAGGDGNSIGGGGGACEEEAAAAAAAEAVLAKAFPQHVDLDDLRAVVRSLCEAHPAAPKVLVGLSAGANLAVAYQGACSDESPFKAAVSVSNGHELTQLTASLMKQTLGDWMLVMFVKGILYERWHEVHELLRRAGLHVDWRRLLALRRIRAFEAMLTARVHGYGSVDDYYTANSSCHHFEAVRAPLLSLANADDPVIDAQLIRHAQDAARGNSSVISVATRRGGHLGWLHGPAARPWHCAVVVEYVAAVLAETIGHC